MVGAKAEEVTLDSECRLDQRHRTLAGPLEGNRPTGSLEQQQI